MTTYIEQLTQNNDIEGLRKEEILLNDILLHYKGELLDIHNQGGVGPLHNRENVERLILETKKMLDYIRDCKQQVQSALEKIPCEY